MLIVLRLCLCQCLLLLLLIPTNYQKRYKRIQIKLTTLHNNKRTIELLLYSAYQKKGNRTLQCSSAFIIQSTEIILSQAERPGF